MYFLFFLFFFFLATESLAYKPSDFDIIVNFRPAQKEPPQKRNLQSPNLTQAHTYTLEKNRHTEVAGNKIAEMVKEVARGKSTSLRVSRVGGENVIKLRAKSNFYNCRITSLGPPPCPPHRLLTYLLQFQIPLQEGCSPYKGSLISNIFK